MQLLKINNVDFTKYINESTYKMNSESVYEEYTDANFRIHKSEYRTRITGEFMICFTTISDYNDFLDALRAASDGSLVTATVYVGGNVNDIATSNFYFNLKSDKTVKINQSHVLSKLAVIVEEY